MEKSGVGNACDSMSVRIKNSGLQCDCRAFLYAFDLCAHAYDCMTLFDVRGCHICSPYRHMHLRLSDVADLSV